MPKDNTLTIERGFDELRKYGYIVDYVNITKGKDNSIIVEPAWGVESCMQCGWPKGTKMAFNDVNGYEAQRDRARDVIGSKVVVVESCTVDRSSSTYKFKGIEGQWNTVMFDPAPNRVASRTDPIWS